MSFRAVSITVVDPVGQPWRSADMGAVVEVSGFDDPKVAEIIKTLRKIRADKPLGLWDATREMIMVELSNTKRWTGPASRRRRRSVLC